MIIIIIIKKMAESSQLGLMEIWATDYGCFAGRAARAHTAVCQTNIPRL
jgi:hypothetical protein